jgi:hypothetical protein
MNKKIAKLLLLATAAFGLSVAALADSGTAYNPAGQCDVNWDCGDQCSTGSFVCGNLGDCSTCFAICQDCP